MKVAVISDIHGNLHALDAVLADIERERPDRVVCAGDIPNPFLRSLDAWLKLKAMGIPLLRGNHEDYIVSYFSGDRPEIRDSVHFQPVQIVARHLGEEIAREMSALPFDLLIDDLYICHASPQHNARSYIRGVDAEMARAFRERVRAAQTVVAGHIHTQWKGEWEGKRLVIGGSVGLPHHGEPEAEYVLLTRANTGQWYADLRTVPYDHEAAIREYRDSSAFAEGGPVARLLLRELQEARPILALILPKILALPAEKRPRTLEEWDRALG